ncbi:uncharacterized mitochondrial protein-like protein, partial [Tanacetum coccineum]
MIGFKTYQPSRIQVQAVPNEDANQKFLRALPSSWNNIALIMRNKDGIDDLDIDDLYNNLKVFEADIKGSSGSSSNSQNVAFLSAEDTSSSNEVNTANGVSTASGHNSQGQASSSSYTDDLMEFSVARTPQQNGVAERKNRTLIEAARTMLADSLLPTVFWAEPVNTACYVLNRVLVTKPHNKTPYELIIGRSPNISPQEANGNTGLKQSVDAGQSEEKNNEQALKNVLDKMMDQEKEASEQSDAKVKILGIFCQCLFDDEDLDTYNSPFADQVMELTKIAQALDDESGVEAMQEELLYSENQKVPDEFNGRTHFLLGFTSKQKEDGIFISQDKYVGKILKKFGFSSVRTTRSPMETNKALIKDEDGEDVDVHLYRSMIGSLMYLTSSRPDIMFSVCACSRFQVQPKVSHLNAVKRIFRYLKGRPNLGLWYPKDSPFILEAFFDSDYAGASLDRKFTTRGCQFLGS